jgi:hypothetical protein
MVRYSIEQHVFLYDTYMKYGSARKCRRKFRDESVPNRETIHDLVNTIRSTGLLIYKKQKQKRRVLTDEKLDDTGARLEHAPRKSLKRLAQDTGVSKSSAKTATKLLNLRPYKNNPRTSYSRSIQIAGFIFAVGFCSLSSKVRSISN